MNLNATCKCCIQIHACMQNLKEMFSNFWLIVTSHLMHCAVVTMNTAVVWSSADIPFCC